MIELPAAGGLTAAGLWLVFLTGLLGGFGHCVGMCGPIVAAFGFSGGAAASVETAAGAAPVRPSTLRPVGLFQIAYQGGRILTYTLLGVALGALGGARVLAAVPGGSMAPLQTWLSVLAGSLMIVMGLALAGVPGLCDLARWVESGAGLSGAGWFSRAAGRLASGGAAAAFPLGMLMGLLPCGLLMTIEIRALAAGSAAAGALTMLAFGLGTVPAMIGFGLASGVMGATTRGWLMKAGAVLVVILGLFTIARALGLPMAIPAWPAPTAVR